MQSNIEMEISKPQSAETKEAVITLTPQTSGPLHATILGTLEKSQDVEQSGLEEERVNTQVTQINSNSDEGSQQESRYLDAQVSQVSQVSDIEIGGKTLENPTWQNISNADKQSWRAQEVNKDSQEIMSQVNADAEAVNQQVFLDVGTQCPQVSQHNFEIINDGLGARKIQDHLDTERIDFNIKCQPKPLYEDHPIKALVREGAIVVPGRQNSSHLPNDIWTKDLTRPSLTVQENNRNDSETAENVDKEQVSGEAFSSALEYLPEDLGGGKSKIFLVDDGSDQIQDDENGNPSGSHPMHAGKGSCTPRKLLAPENISYARHYIGISQMPKICRTTVNCFFAFLYLITQRKWSPDLLKVKMKWFLNVDKLCLYFPSKIRHLSDKEVFLDKLDDAMLKIGEMLYNQRNPDGPQWVRPRRMEGYNTQHPRYKDIRIPFIGWNRREDQELLIFTNLVLGKKKEDLEIDKALAAKGEKPTVLAAETRRLVTLTCDLSGLLSRIDELRSQLDEEVTKQLNAEREAQKHVGIIDLGDEKLNEEEWIERHTYYYYNDTAKQKRVIKKAQKSARLTTEITQIRPPQAKLENEQPDSMDISEKPVISTQSEADVELMDKSEGKKLETQDSASQKEDEGFITADECPSEQKARKVSNILCRSAGPPSVSNILGNSTQSKATATPTTLDQMVSQFSGVVNTPKEDKSCLTKNFPKVGKPSETANSVESSIPPRSCRIKIVIVSKPGYSINPPPAKKQKPGDSHSHLRAESSDSDSEEETEEYSMLSLKQNSKANRTKRRIIIDSDDDDDYVPEKGGLREAARWQKKATRRSKK